MATTMKSNNAAIAAMQQMLQERCIADQDGSTEQEHGRRSKSPLQDYPKERSMRGR